MIMKIEISRHLHGYEIEERILMKMCEVRREEVAR
jgi:hypothetical protein